LLIRIFTFRSFLILQKAIAITFWYESAKLAFCEAEPIRPDPVEQQLPAQERLGNRCRHTMCAYYSLYAQGHHRYRP
jgi:hypothetical protein